MFITPLEAIVSLGVTSAIYVTAEAIFAAQDKRAIKKINQNIFYGMCHKKDLRQLNLCTIQYRIYRVLSAEGMYNDIHNLRISKVSPNDYELSYDYAKYTQHTRKVNMTISLNN